jgi:hypothetical protein
LHIEHDHLQNFSCLFLVPSNSLLLLSRNHPNSIKHSINSLNSLHIQHDLHRNSSCLFLVPSISLILLPRNHLNQAKHSIDSLKSLRIEHDLLRNFSYLFLVPSNSLILLPHNPPYLSLKLQFYLSNKHFHYLIYLFLCYNKYLRILVKILNYPI